MVTHRSSSSYVAYLVKSHKAGKRSIIALSMCSVCTLNTSAFGGDSDFAISVARFIILLRSFCNFHSKYLKDLLGKFSLFSVGDWIVLIASSPSMRCKGAYFNFILTNNIFFATHGKIKTTLKSCFFSN
ncbi:MAG: hypothetical protein CEN87_74 [Parcubacteria group bacterium Licking1014_1]|nr:MAG: hypothetical protein CEN87_74 [Parcubacteria group bacterium Licking1014_1]